MFVASWVVEVFGARFVALDLVAEEGLRAEDEAGLDVFEGGLDQRWEVELVGVDLLLDILVLVEQVSGLQEGAELAELDDLVFVDDARSKVVVERFADCF